VADHRPDVADLALVDVRDRDEALARLRRRGWHVDAVLLGRSDAEAESFARDAGKLVRRWRPILLGDGSGDEVVVSAMDRVGAAIGELAAGRPEGYTSLVSVGSGAAHLAAGLVKRGMPTLLWFAELPADGVGSLAQSTVDAYADESAGPSPTPPGDGSPLVTVAIATHSGHDRITACLDSVAAQTAEAFEVVVVDNGPDTGTSAVVRAWAEAHPGIPVTLERLEVANVAGARNRALDLARGAYVAFVDDDDRIAPRYLEALLTHASPRRVPVAMPLVAQDGDFDHLAGPLGNWSDLRAFTHRSYHQAEVQTAWAPVWAKLVATDVARRVRFDERLAGVAEDVVFCLRAAATERLRLVLTELTDDAAYLYARRSGGLTRPDAVTFEAYVEQPLHAVAAIAEVGVLDRDDLREVGRRVVSHASKRIGEYLAAQPGDRQRVDAAASPFRAYLEA